MKKRSFLEANMLSGSIVKNLVIFALPLMFTNLLQSLYNMADMIVLGRFAGKEAFAAVGATGSTYNLIINIFLGVATGAGVLVAQQMGARDTERLNKTIHTSAAVSLILGVVVGAIGLAFSPFILKAIDTPEDIFDGAVLYLRIMFLGIPAQIAAAFGGAILRSAGDSRHPMYYLSAAGVLNVILNIFFVLGFNMKVEGVALATIISQYLSAFLMWRHLYKTGECYYFSIKETKIHKQELWDMVKIGIPSGLQMSMFSISNLIIQSAINSFGTDYVAANTTSGNVENLCLITLSSLTQAIMIFAGQNFGAKNIKRLKELLLKGMALTCVWALFFGFVCTLLGRPLMHIYTSEEHIIEIGMQRLSIICPLYFLCGLYESALGLVRGMGYSLTPMIAAVLGICAFRIVYIYFIFPVFKSYTSLLFTYPISWFITFLFMLALFVIYYNRHKKLIEST
ncbi:MAG: MATE family efflux transporter [Ruminococcaceae bacterium]|nr:MATE family efflux transporter [Oscillospiraceae bacterium]